MLTPQGKVTPPLAIQTPNPSNAGTHKPQRVLSPPITLDCLVIRNSFGTNGLWNTADSV